MVLNSIHSSAYLFMSVVWVTVCQLKNEGKEARWEETEANQKELKGHMAQRDTWITWFKSIYSFIHSLFLGSY